MKAIEAERCLRLNAAAPDIPLFGAKRDVMAGQRTPWRISPTPYFLSSKDAAFFQELGDTLLGFYRAANQLYLESVKGRQPAWIAEYLDAGKPPELVAYSRMNRFKSQLPVVLRPDVLPLEDGFALSELDSVPGGIGFTGWLGQQYGNEGFSVLGGTNGMVEGFAAAIRNENPETSAAIAVSREANDYWEEMVWLGGELNRLGLPTRIVRPEELRFDEEGLSVDGRPVNVLYRFFELFDIKNVPKAELILYSAKKERVRLTPPFKPYLEEKSLFALFHHPGLRPFWRDALGADRHEQLCRILPKTWILDNRPLPPHAVIPGLSLGDKPLQSWEQLKAAKKSERDYVLKLSGFSENAWGSKSVGFGKDLSSEDWSQALDQALGSFPANPYVLQEHRKPRRLTMQYYDFPNEQLVDLQGRARLCPFYFVQGDSAVLGGILATVCPSDKLAIHGMTDAIMAPCAVLSDQ